jgi:AcrR family transcriptional regulator
MKVFAERNYRDATTRMICTEARVNVALVNYYFRSKAELYKTVIAELFADVAESMLSIPDTVHDEKTWRAAVHTWVRRSLAICAAQEPPEFYIARLIGREENEPSELTNDIEQKFAEPMRHCFRRLVLMAVPHADEETISLWASTVNAQTVIYALTKSGWLSKFCSPTPEFNREHWLDRVADHVCEGIFCRLSFHRTV